MKTHLSIKIHTLFYVAMLATSSAMLSQEIQNSRIISFAELSSIIDQKYANPDQSKYDGACPWVSSANIFPINGCHTFSIQQSFYYGIGGTDVSTTVKICCICAVCAPMAGGRWAGVKGNDRPKTVQITKSSAVKFDKYMVSIATGIYDIDPDGNYINLKFSIIENP